MKEILQIIYNISFTLWLPSKYSSYLRWNDLRNLCTSATNFNLWLTVSNKLARIMQRWRWWQISDSGKIASYLWSRISLILKVINQSKRLTNASKMNLLKWAESTLWCYVKNEIIKSRKKIEKLIHLNISAMCSNALLLKLYSSKIFQSKSRNIFLWNIM